MSSTGAEAPAQLLAEHVLSMDFVSEKGKRARQLAREVLADEDHLRRALRLIEHATSPAPDDGGFHEAAYDIAVGALASQAGAEPLARAALRELREAISGAYYNPTPRVIEALKRVDALPDEPHLLDHGFHETYAEGFGDGKEQADAESKALHEWLDSQGIPRGETDGPAFNLRSRVEIALTDVSLAGTRVIDLNEGAQAGAEPLRPLLLEWEDGLYDGPDFLRRVRLALHGPLKPKSLKRAALAEPQAKPRNQDQVYPITATNEGKEA